MLIEGTALSASPILGQKVVTNALGAVYTVIGLGHLGLTAFKTSLNGQGTQSTVSVFEIGSVLAGKTGGIGTGLAVRELVLTQLTHSKPI